MASTSPITSKRRSAPKKVSEDGAVVKKGNKLVVVGKPANVAEYLIGTIAFSGKSQADIASEVGFPKANMITMLKKGLTKLPIDKIGVMSKSLGVDPLHLYRMCMMEYYPDTWKMLQGFLNQPTLTEHELEIISVIRESNVINPKLRTEEDKIKLLEFINTLK